MPEEHIQIQGGCCISTHLCSITYTIRMDVTIPWALSKCWVAGRNYFPKIALAGLFLNTSSGQENKYIYIFVGIISWCTIYYDTTNKKKNIFKNVIDVYINLLCPLEMNHIKKMHRNIHDKRNKSHISLMLISVAQETKSHIDVF